MLQRMQQMSQISWLMVEEGDLSLPPGRLLLKHHFNASPTIPFMIQFSFKTEKHIMNHGFYSSRQVDLPSRTIYNVIQMWENNAANFLTPPQSHLLSAWRVSQYQLFIVSNCQLNTTKGLDESFPLLRPWSLPPPIPRKSTPHVAFWKAICECGKHRFANIGVMSVWGYVAGTGCNSARWILSWRPSFAIEWNAQLSRLDCVWLTFAPVIHRDQ